MFAAWSELTDLATNALNQGDYNTLVDRKLALSISRSNRRILALI